MASVFRHLALLLGLVLVAVGIIRGASKWLERLGTRNDLEPAERKPREDAVVTGAAYLLLTLAGLYAAAEAALVLSAPKRNMVFVVFFAALAGLQAGGIIGFIFGVPRTVQMEGATMQSSTSLEQIADWLTKIIVGIGLVEAKEIYALFKRGTDFLAVGFAGPPATARVVGAAIMIFFPIAGFLGTYLLTRLYLAAALGRAEKDMRSAFQRAGVKPEEARDARAGMSKMLFRLLTEKPIAVEQLPKEARDVLERMGKLDYDQLRTPEEYATWAIAKLKSGNFNDALRAFRRATEMEPDSAEFAFGYAVALSKTGASNERVEEALRKALQNVNEKTDPEIRENIYNSLVYLLLYKAGGYNEVITLAEKYAKDSPFSGNIFVNLLCAYGQQLSALRADQSAATPAILDVIRQKALATLKRILTEDPSWRDWLQVLTFPDHPYKKAVPPKYQNEDDLEVFAQDAEFVEILGRPSGATTTPKDTPPAA